MGYAVFQLGNKQYTVSEGDVVRVDKLVGKNDEKVRFDKVLLWVSDKDFYIGNPHIEGLSITGTIVDQIKGKKVRVAKFKSKVRYRRVSGFRAEETRVKIEKIESNKEQSKTSEKKPSKAVRARAKQKNDIV